MPSRKRWKPESGSVPDKHQAPVVQRMDNAMHRINHYPLDSLVCFANTYPLDSDLSGGSIIHLLNDWGQLYGPLACWSASRLNIT